MNDTALDMMELARFAVLPGANRLIQAFASIPPGPMRDAVIHLAETTAQTYSGARRNTGCRTRDKRHRPARAALSDQAAQAARRRR